MIGFCQLGTLCDETVDWNSSLPDLKPIPLSESILEKCGFEKHDVSSYWIIKDWEIYYCTFNKGIRIIGKGWICDFFYLHQLQNLYFSLTCTELTVKL